MSWQFGQFVPIRFKHLESTLFWEWPGKSLALYLYMRRFVWRSREGALGHYYSSGLLTTAGYLGTWAAASKSSKSSVSRWLTWMKNKGIIRCLVDSQATGGKDPNIYALGAVFDVPGGEDSDAVEVFFLDTLQTELSWPPAIEVPEELSGLQEIVDPDLKLVPRWPVAPVEQGVAPVEQGVAPVEQGVAPVQGSNREVIENGIEKVIVPASGGDTQDGSRDESWLKESRIKGESQLEGMTPEEKAKVASPAEPDPATDRKVPAWESEMRKRLKGQTVAGDFTADDVVNYCRRFYGLTGNPPPSYAKGNLDWMHGARKTLESFHSSLATLYETRHQRLPNLEKRRRLFNSAVDLFFVTGSGYDHITAQGPRSLAGSMPGLIGNLVEIANDCQCIPEREHIEAWVERRKNTQKGRGRTNGGEGPLPFNGSVRTTGATESELAAAERILARQAAGA